ncbi:hypothetical protein D0869_14669 [Hortaea werneckii]|uniref:UV-endonuclease UvdE n=1 Tax=Hortaea werneckii TaxID=91943 RepID=A0A3M6W224_HORWE|nr:UV-damage [Hortaea werneckii]KAI7567657.1 UV-damage [Hortaea werneckii]RMX72386.1 hypothetical protein D0869_14669 [Hortaea werneckii]
MAATKRKAAAAVTQSKAQPNGDAPPVKRRASSRKASTAAAPAALNPDVDQDVVDAPNDREASPDEAAGHQPAAGPEQQAIGVEREIRPKSESPLSDAPAVVEPPKGRRGRGQGKQAVDGARDGVQQTDQNDGNAQKPPPAKKGRGKKVKQEDGDVAATEQAVGSKPPGKAQKSENNNVDPEAEGEDEVPDEEEVKEALARPPPVNSDYLPLPWKGRLGYACLNTYLRASNPPVFSSRTCRIQSILEHRHPLQNPDKPEHPTKNKPDKSKPADVELGKRYLENICLANVKDISKMIRWNERYHIRFLRLSSEMFPFASHPEYGYKLAPFASEALAEAGRVIGELGHRVTTHPGQFTQLGSPRKQVIENAFRDLEYHDEMLSLLKLPEQQDKDAVMIMHMGGIFDGKGDTLQRFRENYANLSPSIKNRLVLENDDVCYSVHELLPICEELNIPFVLDYHHHNIVFDSDKIREGTRDIMDLYPRIKATWDRKGITQKMHYSEPTPPAVTPRQRRKHNPRPLTLPPCSPDMDLMIEAKDKEQAVFELMRTFKLPGFDSFNDVVPYLRNDDNKVAHAAMNRKKKSADEPEPVLIPDEEVGMGGPEGRVYWPPGMEEWLRPKKREVKKKEPAEAEANSTKSKEQKKKEAAEMYAAREAEKLAENNGGGEDGEDSEEGATPATKKAKAAMKKKEARKAAKKAAKAQADAAKNATKAEATGNAKQNGTKTNGSTKSKPTPPKKATARGKKQQPTEEASVPTPSPSEDDTTEPELDDEVDDQPISPAVKRRTASSRKPSGRQAKTKKVSYAEDGEESMEDA